MQPQRCLQAQKQIDRQLFPAQVMAEQAQPLLEDYNSHTKSSQNLPTRHEFSFEDYTEKRVEDDWWRRIGRACSGAYKYVVLGRLVSESAFRRFWQGSFSEVSSSTSFSDDDLDDRLHDETENRWLGSIPRKSLSAIGNHVILILPRFLRPGGFEPYNKLHSTSYLDALRGFAALIVLAHHRWPLGAPLELFKLPILRIVTAGRGSVDVFFVISGYVLSTRTLKAVHQREKVKLLDALASSVFRRYLRLFLPCAVATFAAMVLVHLGWASPQMQELDFRPGLLEQLWDWFMDFVWFANPFSDLQGGYWHPDYVSSRYFVPLQVLWTIPVEFRGSMVVFSFVLAVCRLKTRSRLALTAALIAMCYCWSAIWAGLFLYGVFLADVSLLLQPQHHGLVVATDLGTTEKPEIRVAASSIRRNVVGALVMLLALFLLGYPIPEEGISSPYTYLVALTPAYLGDQWAGSHFYPSFGAALLVLTLDFCPMLRKPLEWRFSQYIGALSFGIYLMHTLVLMSIWDRWLVPWQVESFGDGYLAGGVSMSVLYFMVFWVADYFERIDRRIVNLGRWIEHRMFVEW